MADKEKKEFKRLKLFYLGIIFVSATLIVPTHIFPSPLFMPVRFPHYLEMMPAFLGISWPMTFEIYHYVLYALAAIASLNVLGVIFYPKFKKIALFSSLIGSFLISFMVLFFFFIFISVNTSASVIYGFYSVVLLIVDLLTFKALITRRKEVSHG